MFKRSLTKIVALLMATTLIPSLSFGAEDAINSGDTAWIIIATAIVMLMTPGLALFYGGMTRSKNILNTLMMSFFILCVVSIQWALFGYSLAFGDDIAGLVGGFNFAFLSGVGMEASGTIPHYVFMIFQGMFAVITVALISGAVIDRMKFSAFVVFALLWTTFVYDPLCHWVWGGGWLGGLGDLDFAGGTVVHISAGVSALVLALCLGKRKGLGSEIMAPHNLPMTMIGAALLWFGWFGFNAGSALAADGVAGLAFVTTNLAASAGAIGWVLIEAMKTGKATMLGTVSGAISGLVAITPATGFVTPMAAIIIGLVGGLVCYLAVTKMKAAFGYDDSLDVFGIHGIGGIWGAIATGIFASVGAEGLVAGNPGQVVTQIIGVGATIVLAAVVTFIIAKVLDAVMGLRVDEESEVEGLDTTMHNESAYTKQ